MAATSSTSSQRPAKRIKTTEQASQQIDALFANPDRALETVVGPKPKTLAPPPEIVANVQGSSAGAGSGEFHVYKASRRREYERLRVMDEEVEKEKADREWEERREEAKRKEEAKLSKNRAKREKQKARQAKGAQDGTFEKKKLGPAKVVQMDISTDGAEVVEEAGITFLEDG